MIDTVTGTYRHNEELLDKLTELSRAERGALIRWLSRQGEATQLEAIRLQTGVLRRLYAGEKRPPQERGEIIFAALILALSRMRHLDSAARRKGTDQETTAKVMDHRIARMRAQRKQKNAPEKEKLRTQYYHSVKELRAKGLSWRECARYLKEHHHQAWSYSWLRNTFQQITRERLAAGVPEREPL